MLTRFFLLLICAVWLADCGNQRPAEKDELVELPEQMNAKVRQLISASLRYAVRHDGIVDDSLRLSHASDMVPVYNAWADSSIWCSAQQWLPPGDSLMEFISESMLYGLFPSDYHIESLNKIREQFVRDSLSQNDRRDAFLWARVDMMLTDALIGMMHDIKLGRLSGDSVTLRKDSLLHQEQILEKVKATAFLGDIHAVIRSMEPAHKGYSDLKAVIPGFLSNADFTDTFQIRYPNEDRQELRAEVLKRLYISGYADSADYNQDSAMLVATLKKYQQEHKLSPDGRIGQQTVRSLNETDRDKFRRICLTLDRYKLLPEEMPQTYLWINIPAFELKLVRNDTVLLTSRVVVGKKITRTPVLTSSIYEMITYPQWNIPQSIIVKEILPALKIDPGYLERKGYSLVNAEGEEVDPFTVNWSLYSKGIPYKIIQGSGDANALGILKFNFSNKYSVYLHDTNQRSYFNLDSRALSHGCIRVQEWEKIAYFILNQEEEKFNQENTGRKPVSIDSLDHWLIRKEKHAIPVRSRLPVFIRYFGCEGIGKKLVFYEDIYDEDRELSDQYLNGKTYP